MAADDIERLVELSIETVRKVAMQVLAVEPSLREAAYAKISEAYIAGFAQHGPVGERALAWTTATVAEIRRTVEHIEANGGGDGGTA